MLCAAVHLEIRTKWITWMFNLVHGNVLLHQSLINIRYSVFYNSVAYSICEGGAANNTLLNRWATEENCRSSREDSSSLVSSSSSESR